MKKKMCGILILDFSHHIWLGLKNKQANFVGDLPLFENWISDIYEVGCGNKKIVDFYELITF